MTTTSYNIFQQITSVRVATTVNLSGNYFNGDLNNGVGATLTAVSVGALTIDGILLEVGDRVLVKDQTSTNQNGLYVVQAKGSFASLWMLERAPDFQSVEQLKVGQYFSVGAGSTLAGSMFVLVEPLPSVIGIGTFNFVDVSDVDTPSGPFLLKSANLSDLSNRETGFSNLGLGSGDLLIIDESDFSAGLYILTNPCPNIIQVNATSPGNAVRLPPVDEAESFTPSQGPVFVINSGFEGIDVQDSNGALISPLIAPATEQFILTSNAFPQGVWLVRSFVSTLNSKSGSFSLVSSDGSITIDSSGTDIDLSVSGGNPSQLIFLDANSGSDTNPGTIDRPLKTYEAANALAISRSPGYGSGQTIVIMSSVQTVADLVLVPYVDIFGFGSYNSIIGVTNSISLHPSWGTAPIPICQIMNVGFVAQNINLVYPAFQDSSIIRFQNCSIQLTDLGAPATITGSNGSGTTFAETVIFDKCNLDISNRVPEPTYNSTNVNIFFWDTNLSGGVTSTVTSSTIHAKLLIQNDPYLTGNITVNAASTGTLLTQITGCNPLGSTLTINGTSNTVSVDASSYNFASFIFSGGASFANIISGEPFLIYIDQVNGDDSNSGTINYPMKTYDAARVQALARGASVNLPFIITVVGVQSITGNMILSPNVNIEGINAYSSGFIVSGNVVIDPIWGLNTSFCQVRNTEIFVGGNYNLIFPAISGQSQLKFVDCQFNNGSTITVTGTGTSSGAENVTFENCTVDFLNYTSNFVAENVNLYLINTDLSASDISLTASSATVVNYVLAINNARFYTGNISVITNNTSAISAYLNATNTMSKNLTINGTNNTVYVDSTSYMFNLVLSGGATLSNLVLPTKTDGMSNTSYTPTSYTPTAGTLFDASTLTGNLKGIDLALASVGGGVVSSQLIFLDANNGNDLNTGTITSPLQTYEACLALAISRSPTYGSDQTIVLMSSVQTSADLVLYPYVHIRGLGQYYSIVGISGSIVLDPAWGTTGGGPFSQIIDVSFVGGGMNLVFPAFQDNAFIRFQHCAMQFLDPGFPANVTGSDGSAGTKCETIIFDKCNLDIAATIDEPAFNGTNVNMFFWDTNISTSVTATITSTTLQAQLIIQDTPYLTGPITLNATSTGTLTTYIWGATTQGSTLTVNGTSNTVNIDSTSYQFASLSFAGGASLSNLNLTSLSDGVNNSSYSPANYTPAAGSNFQSTSLTGNLKGIDNALPKESGSATLVGGTVTVLSTLIANGDSIDLTCTAAGGVQGFITVTYTPGVSFTLTSSSALDTSTFKWKNLGA